MASLQDMLDALGPAPPQFNERSELTGSEQTYATVREPNPDYQSWLDKRAALTAAPPQRQDTPATPAPAAPAPAPTTPAPVIVDNNGIDLGALLSAFTPQQGQSILPLVALGGVALWAFMAHKG